MQKNYGLLYTNKEGTEYLYKSCYSIEEVVAALESEDFKKIEKEKVFIIKLEEPIIKEVNIKGEVK